DRHRGAQRRLPGLHRQGVEDVAAVHLELRMSLVLDLQQQVAAIVALPGQAYRLAGADALGHTHVQLAAVEVDAHAVAAVDGLQRHRKLGPGIPARLRARAGRATPSAGTLAREQALEEVAEAAATRAAAHVAEDLLAVEAGAIEPARRRMELLAGTVAACAQLVVGGALLRIAQGLVGLADGLELLLGVRLLAHVRVVLAGEPAVGRADLGLAGARLDPED